MTFLDFIQRCAVIEMETGESPATVALSHYEWDTLRMDPHLLQQVDLKDVMECKLMGVRVIVGDVL